MGVKRQPVGLQRPAVQIGVKLRQALGRSQFFHCFIRVVITSAFDHGANNVAECRWLLKHHHVAGVGLNHVA